jgi:hypothetical protein
MDFHEEILQRSRAIVSDSRAHISRWALDKETTRKLLGSARERIFHSQEGLRQALTYETLPFSWFKHNG